MIHLNRLLNYSGAIIVAMLILGCNKDSGTNPENKCLCEPGNPAIIFSYVPSKGSDENLRGCVCNASPADHALAIYINVAGGYWTKPYWAYPLTFLKDDGSWECDITTGGIDERATEIVAYLVPQGYDPPLMRGGLTLPAVLDSVAVAKARVTR